MIYENEELRMRTININAEVERGQSDIRKLRRENENLRREIWALRDEYDRLDKLLSGANLNKNNNSNSCNNNNNNNSSRPPSGGSSGSSSASGSSDGSASSDGESENNSCDEIENGEKLNETADCETLDNTKNFQKSTIVKHNGGNMVPPYSPLLKNRDNLHVNFDHLSIVSEETLTSTPNSPTSPNPEILNELLNARLISPLDPVSSLTPLNELQSVQPPLYHFENLSYETLGPSIDSNGQILKPPQLIAPAKLAMCPKPRPVFFGPMRPSNSIECLKKADQPLYATIKKSQKLTLPTSNNAAIAFQNGGNLEDLLNEITLSPRVSVNLDQTMQPDIVAIEGDKLDSQPVSPNNPRKHRSQINLVLNYTGPKPIPNDKVHNEPSPASTETNLTVDNTTLENRLNKIGFEKFINTTRPEHIYSRVDTPPPTLSTPHLSNGSLNCNGSGPKPLDKPHEKLPPAIEVKRKSRRVSLCFNGRKTVDAKKGRRASIDVVSIEKNLADFSNSTTPFQRRHSTNLHQHHHHSNHPSRKSSHESIKVAANGVEAAAPTTVETSSRRSLSRESTSSIITQKSRKASASSQGSKIPWCACWGNGCF